MVRQVQIFWAMLFVVLLATSCVGRSLHQAPGTNDTGVISDEDPRSYAGYQSSSWALPLDYDYEDYGPSVEPAAE